MTDALSSPNAKLQRPPVSGPGSDTEKWRAFVAQETGRTDLDGMSRDKLIEILEHEGPQANARHVPDDVELHDPVEIDNGMGGTREVAPALESPAGGPEWAVPVEGGYVAESELVTAERKAERERTAKRHADRLRQLKERNAR